MVAWISSGKGHHANVAVLEAQVCVCTCCISLSREVQTYLVWLRWSHFGHMFIHCIVPLNQGSAGGEISRDIFDVWIGLALQSHV